MLIIFHRLVRPPKCEKANTKLLPHFVATCLSLFDCFVGSIRTFVQGAKQFWYWTKRKLFATSRGKLFRFEEDKRIECSRPVNIKPEWFRVTKSFIRLCLMVLTTIVSMYNILSLRDFTLQGTEPQSFPFEIKKKLSYRF